MARKRFVVVLGAGQGDLLLSPEMKEWVINGRLKGVAFNQDTKDRVCRALSACWKNDPQNPAPLIITSGYPYKSEAFNGTVGSAMERYVNSFVREYEGAGYKRPHLIVNRRERLKGLTKEMRWASAKAEEFAGCEGTYLEFVGTRFQTVLMTVEQFFRGNTNFRFIPISADA